ncbi:MAG: DUF1553 domain-containing protein [Verrucomicrobiaceae bacterium]|nr:DUF1553 domain-containing protein [Verrucomicrobiaceae bacterium]
MRARARRSVPLFSIAALTLTGSTLADTKINFVRDVRPLFEAHCYDCHGPEKQKSGFRLDVKAAALKGGDNHGPDILPGKAQQSPLIHFVTTDQEDEIMPPRGAPLSAKEIAILTAWINEGAVWPDGVDRTVLKNTRDHWSFKPLSPTESPTPGSPDGFIEAALAERGLTMSPPADRVAWLRRVCFDLIGLPPTPEQVEAFVKDSRDDAFERIVDHLLASPRYGERWAQHWLDVVRYADTHGFEVNTERPNAWPYRDYVIRAFNDDIPYDQFIREQIAGDAYGKDAATGFLVTASVLLPAQIGKDAASKRLARQDSLDEIVMNIGQTFLGLSIGCARCHDHKFDPIRAEDYYAMQAFVAGVEYADRDLRTPEAEAARAEAARLTARQAEIDRTLIALVPPADSGAERPIVSTGENADRFAPEKIALSGLSPDEAERVASLLREKTANETKIKMANRAGKVFAGRFREPDKIHLLNRGDPEQPRDLVDPAILSAFGDISFPQETPEQKRRLLLADWIASPDNPLTARVMVNRIWQGHFGAGIVPTPSDFGNNGVPPSHPELLDWLAAEFIRSGWSVKHMHRLIVLSRTYRQRAAHHPDGAAKDADVRLLWRYPLRRLEAESIRDSMLAVSGRLNLKMYGVGYNLFAQRGGLSGFDPVESFTGEGLRRMIYAHKVRRETAAVFGAFDCPDAGQSAAVRRESTTPIQALNLFNSRFTLDQCEAFAERVVTEVGDDPRRQIARAYEIAFNRLPDAEELRECEPVVRDHGLATLCRALFNSNEFLFVP